MMKGCPYLNTNRNEFTKTSGIASDGHVKKTPLNNVNVTDEYLTLHDILHTQKC